MTVPLMDLTAQYAALKSEIDEALLGAVASQRFILGPEVDTFEKEVSEYLGVRHAVGCASGTDALLLPLKSLPAAPGSDVIVPSFTFFATAGAVWNAGFRPVFCDVDPETFNVTAESLDEVWTERTVAVVAVHLFGQMAPMREILELARSRGAFVLEDTAQAIGATSLEGMAGSVGDAGAFSFFPTKNLGGYGDGGLVTTNDDDLAEAIRKLRVHGGQRMYHHESVGFNSRLDAIQASILRVKLPHLNGWAEARRVNAERYREGLAEFDSVLAPLVLEGNLHVYNQFTVRVGEGRRDDLRQFLTDRSIGSGIYYPVPLHMQDCFSELGGGGGDLPVTEALCREVLSLPIFPELGESRQAKVIDAVRSFYT
ncbi:DegT/DnrJ/EryC1/StrS family aminotransferase [Gemmatimonadales bacterium]|nr:DegT/DnrJ/EryC1/StrS family aminotransferase [Gemmatimonadales bacterium]MDC0160811.1 DegT/DnrJ/EryC1/StrS family aminotransferase [Gemmatimonadales bacterium]